MSPNLRICLFATAISTCHLLGAWCHANDSGTAPPSKSVASQRWLLICCGLPGDEEHRERMTDACKKIAHASESILGVAPGCLRLMAGDQTMQEDLQGIAKDIEITTGEAVEATLASLSETIEPEDEFWLIMIGHAHLYHQSSQFNVGGKDFDQFEFAKCAKNLKSKTQVFFLTMPLSGFWMKSVATDHRIIITATEADHEATGTELPYALADILAGETEARKLNDVDGDGGLSLLDLYLAVNLEIAARFRESGFLQTEHAQLEDNGDGMGSEPQQPYLPTQSNNNASPEDREKEQNAQTSPPLIEEESLDGCRSRSILLKAHPTPSSTESDDA